MTKIIHFIKIIIPLLLLASGIFGKRLTAQETSLSAKKVPVIIKDFIGNNYPKAKQIKYFKELENDTVFIECEFKVESEKYAIRFLQNGTTYEVERGILFKDIAENVSLKIKDALNKQFKTYKIHECFIVNPQTQCIYEIYVKGSFGKRNGLFEVYFDKEGGFIKMEEEIIQPISTEF